MSHYYKNNLIQAIRVSDVAQYMLNNRSLLPEWIRNRHGLGTLRLSTQSGVIFVNEYGQEVETGPNNWLYLDPTGVVRTCKNEVFNEHFDLRNQQD